MKKENNLYKEGVDYSILDENTLPFPYSLYVKLIGLENFLKLIKYFGGKNIYIPKDGAMENIILTKKIKEEYNGKNIKQLSEKYHITRESVYAHLKK